MLGLDLLNNPKSFMWWFYLNEEAPHESRFVDNFFFK